MTDQQAVSLTFDSNNKDKIKNDKVQRCKPDLACFDFAISFRSGKQNTVANAEVIDFHGNPFPLVLSIEFWPDEQV